ncbi:uncharacterized protein LOC111319743 [Stylophora pistillata]|uniref:uncharacterized protein LOC111319743 n=1 Tax=Stylophora pistillata TaxID=50429 RepID=UPI000C057C05|nr:uncharacterized protein LOC111319743 [Stylophora pistillata]
MSATFKGRLAASKYLSHLCVVKTSGQSQEKRFLQVKAKLEDNESTGKRFLHASVYGADEPRLLGNLDIWKSNGDWSSLIICPPRDQNDKDQEKHLLLLGTPNLAFKVQVESSVQEIKLDEAKTFDLRPSESNKVFQFIPTGDISDKQLDVTVISESDDVPAYLKVSRDCEDVNENIDIVDYKGESIRLSFAKKGRITLSRVSIPPLTDSIASWFIGIAIKNATGETPEEVTKTVTLTLKRSFDYAYFSPIVWVVILPAFAFGILVAVCGICCFPIAHNTTDIPSNRRENFEATEVKENQQGEQKPLVGTSRRSSEFMWYWFERGPKTYSYITVIVGFVLMIGAGQYVFANWRLMIEEGDRDTCYYNDFCYRVSNFDIPFNLMISNLAYMIHGLILALSLMIMERKLFSVYGNNILPPKHAFSMGYAFAWAIFFEGCFSLVYHLCPSKLTFQFDTGFMFVIAGLIIVLLYNGIEMKQNVGKRGYVDAANFFLYFLVPLYIFNYFGTLSHSETGLVNTSAFYVFVVIWWIFITIWTGWKLFPDRNSSINIIKCFGFFLGFVAPAILFGYFRNNIPEVFLFSCIGEGIIAIFFNALCNRKDITWAKKWWHRICQFGYGLIMVVLWVLAVFYFVKSPTTDKTLTPEKSRDYNQDCIVEGFFDHHDLWHILSSHALLMTAYFVMFTSHKSG